MSKEEKRKIKDNSFGVASVILGIVGLTISSLSGVILGVVGLIFGLKQKKLIHNSWSRAGVTLNIITIIIGLIMFIWALITFLNNPDFLSQLQSQIPNA